MRIENLRTILQKRAPSRGDSVTLAVDAELVYFGDEGRPSYPRGTYRMTFSKNGHDEWVVENLDVDWADLIVEPRGTGQQFGDAVLLQEESWRAVIYGIGGYA